MTNTPPSRFPYRLAAIDIDGTLLGPDSQVSPENIAAVARLREHGVHVVLASGRRHENMLRFHHLLGLDGPLVSCQGALVKETTTDRVIQSHSLPAGLAATIVTDGLAEGMTLIYYRMDGICIAEKDSNTDLYHSRGGDVLIEYGSLEKLAGETPLKIIWMNTPQVIAARTAEIHARYLGRAETVVTYPEYLEFMDHGVNKAVGVSAVAEYYGVASSEVLAFGDGNNDVAMLEWAGCGVAMSESAPAAREAANIVTPEGDPATSLARAIDAIIG